MEFLIAGSWCLSVYGIQEEWIGVMGINRLDGWSSDHPFSLFPFFHQQFPGERMGVWTLDLFSLAGRGVRYSISLLALLPTSNFPNQDVR